MKKWDNIRVTLILGFKRITPKSDFISKAIGWKTNSNYSHVELGIKIDTKELDTADIRELNPYIGYTDFWISSRSKTGITIRFLEPFKEDKYDYHELHTTMQMWQLKRILHFIYLLQNDKYDHLGIILSQIIPLGIDRNNKWTCSEITTKILQLFLVENVLKFEPISIAPGDLAKLFRVEK